MRPPERARTTSTSSRRPGTKRSSPMRRSGPLGTSRMPVASTTRAPGWPSAKRPYQSSTSRVTAPSSLARHGTMAGTQVRVRSRSGPTRSGEKSRLARASSAVGQRASSTGWRLRAARFEPSVIRRKPNDRSPPPPSVLAPAGRPRHTGPPWIGDQKERAAGEPPW